jgi:hypothetical protein
MERMDASCMDLLAEEVNDRRVSILLFLTAETPRDPRAPAVRRRMVRLELPDHYFPRTFVIRDACVIMRRPSGSASMRGSDPGTRVAVARP